MIYLTKSTVTSCIASKTATPSCSFRFVAFRFDRLCPLRSSPRSDRTLQTGRRRDERGRGPGLCTAAQKPRQTCDGSHESLGEGRDAQRRSFNQSPQHLTVPLARKGEYLARAEAAAKSTHSKHTLAASDPELALSTFFQFGLEPVSQALLPPLIIVILATTRIKVRLLCRRTKILFLIHCHTQSAAEPPG